MYAHEMTRISINAKFLQLHIATCRLKEGSTWNVSKPPLLKRPEAIDEELQANAKISSSQQRAGRIFPRGQPF